jgi:hypothetical protein
MAVALPAAPVLAAVIDDVAEQDLNECGNCGRKHCMKQCACKKYYFCCKACRDAMKPWHKADCKAAAKIAQRDKDER